MKSNLKVLGVIFIAVLLTVFIIACGGGGGGGNGAGDNGGGGNNINAGGWEKTFGDTGSDRSASVQQTTDGGYIVSGRNSDNNGDIWLIKTNANGNETWSKTFGGAQQDEDAVVQQTTDGGYILAGETDSYGAGARDIWLIKTDANGNETWSKTFGGLDWDYSPSVVQTTDGGYIVTGITGWRGAIDPDASHAYLLKTDANGNMMWEKTFGGLDYGAGASVQQTTDGGYIIVGDITSYGSGNGDVYLLKTDTNGNVLWEKTFGGINYDSGRSVQQTQDGGYIITGETKSYGAGDSDVWLIKTDASGNEVWSKTFGGFARDYGASVRQTSDNGYIVTGQTSSYGAGNGDVWLIKTDTNGNQTWSKTFGGPDWDYGTLVQQTSDNGYVVTGSTYSYGAGSADFYVIKTDANGNIN